MYRYNLATLMVDCPPAWINLVRSIQPEKGAGIKITDVVKALKEFNVVEVNLSSSNAHRPLAFGDVSHLIFETEEDATAFVLKWS